MSLSRTAWPRGDGVGKGAFGCTTSTLGGVFAGGTGGGGDELLLDLFMTPPLGEDSEAEEAIGAKDAIEGRGAPLILILRSTLAKKI